MSEGSSTVQSWNSLDLSCLLSVLSLYVNQSLLIAEMYQHSIASTTLTWLRPPWPSHGLQCEIVCIYLVLCVLYVNQSLLIAEINQHSITSTTLTCFYFRNVPNVHVDWRTVLRNGLLHLSCVYRHPLWVSSYGAAAHAHMWLDPTPARSDRVGNRRRHPEHCVVDWTNILGIDYSSSDLILCLLRSLLQDLLFQVRTL